MDVKVVNVSYFIPKEAGTSAKTPGGGTSGAVAEQEQHMPLLHSVSAKFRRGTVTALMGPSGAGKTTLMDLVAEKKFSGTRTGHILYGEATCIRSKQDVAYIQSSDVHIGEFTVAQNLYFAALLRLGSGMSAQELDLRCKDSASAVGLSGVMGVPVGTELVKGISGGQKKRLSVAIELLAIPSTMCLDEPTTGLDSSTSLQLAECLASIATDLNTTIICTVHQPSVDMLKCWQQLVLLADGRIAYMGPIFDIVNYLQYLGHTCNTDNPVEFALELLGAPDVAASVTNSWVAASKSHPMFLIETEPLKGVHNGAIFSMPSVSRSDTTFVQQTYILAQRHFLAKLKSPNGFFAMALRNVLAGLLFAMLYFGDGASLKKEAFIINPSTNLFSAYCNNILGFNFACLIFLLFANSISVPALFSSRRLFDREQGEKLYSYWSYWVGTMLIDIPELMVGTFIFDVIVSETIQLNGDRGVFYVMTLLTSLVGYSMAKLCAWLTSSSLSSLVLFAMGCNFNILTCGFFIVSDNIDPYLRWLLYICFPQWSIGQLTYNELHDFKGAQSEAVLDYYSFNDKDLGNTSMVLLLFFVGFEIMSLICMRPILNQVEIVDESSPEATHLNTLLAKGTNLGGDTVTVSTSVSSSVSSSVDAVAKTPKPKKLSALKGPSAPISLASIKLRMSARNLKHQLSFATIVRVRVRVRDALLRNTYTENKQVFERIEDHVGKIHLEFRDVIYSVGKGNTSKVLLNGVFGDVKPGEMLAVMGSSGAGKTTLLNVIAGRANSGSISGTITANGETFMGFRRNATASSNKNTAPSFAYVMQDDVHIASFTVRETLEFAAMLRLRAARRSDKRVQAAVNKIIKMLGLKKITENVIGTPEHRNISCGQLRRLSIGVEIVHDPMLIFLDEPTSGLDSYLAATVIEGMKTLANSGRTLLCTIHQPSIEVFSQFNKLLLLSAGYPVYFGPVTRCRAHFETMGIPCNNDNPAEYVIMVADIAASNNSKQDAVYTSKSLAFIMTDTAMETPDSPLCKPASVGTTASVALNDWSIKGIIYSELTDLLNAWPLMLVLVQRDWLCLRRQGFLRSISIRMAVIGIFLGLLWRDVNDNDYLERISLFAGCYFMTTVWLVEIIPSLHEAKVMFYRERDASATSTMASWITQGLPTAACAIVFVMLFCVPVYTISGLNKSIGNFMFFFAVMYVLTIANLFVQQAIATITPSPMIHTIFFPGLVVPIQGMFSGYVVLVETMEPWFKWGTTLNSVFWMFNALFQNEFQSNVALNGVNKSALEVTYVWGASASTALVGIIAIMIVHKALAYVGMRFVNHSSA